MQCFHKVTHNVRYFRKISHTTQTRSDQNSFSDLCNVSCLNLKTNSGKIRTSSDLPWTLGTPWSLRATNTTYRKWYRTTSTSRLCRTAGHNTKPTKCLNSIKVLFLFYFFSTASSSFDAGGFDSFILYNGLSAYVTPPFFKAFHIYAFSLPGILTRSPVVGLFAYRWSNVQILNLCVCVVVTNDNFPISFSHLFTVIFFLSLT